MFQAKVVYLLFLLCWSCSLINCVDVEVNSDLKCEQYANDLEILSKFPFAVSFDYKQQGPGKSLAILHADNVSVSMLALKQAGAVVPESVFCMKKLQSLQIENMIFSDNTVPDALSNLQELFSFEIVKTPLTKVTDKIITLQKLQSISINNCSLAEMPSLHGMYNLNTVSLPNNHLSKLEGLTNVSRLWIYKNQFNHIPAVKLPGRLTMLNMNYNPIENMEIITSFVNISDVRLSVTKIPAIPSGISDLERLSFLDVSFGQLTDVPNTISEIPHLQYLVIYGNQFTNETINSIKDQFSTNRPAVNLLI